MAATARADEIFRQWLEAIQRGEPVELEQLCGGRAELVNEVKTLIHGRTEDNLAFRTPPRDTAALGGRSFEPGIEVAPGYVLLEPLGRGGFGEVWKAQASGGFEVAMKLIRIDPASPSVELRSLELMKAIRHANLVALFGAWQEGGLLIVAMELADGALLDRLHAARRAGLPGIPGPELLDYMRDAARGIDFLNEPCHYLDGKEGVAIQHRDIKPHNLLLVGGSVKVADFGLAKLLEGPTGSNTGSMTLAYAPPEFFRRKTTAYSDQYSLAVTYCQLRGDRLPFDGSPAAIMAGHLLEAPNLSMIPECERPIVAQALSKDPEARWPSCRAFVQALAAMMKEEAAPGPVRRPIHDRSTEPLTLPWPVGRNRLVGMAVALLLLGLVGLAAFFGRGLIPGGPTQNPSDDKSGALTDKPTLPPAQPKDDRPPVAGETPEEKAQARLKKGIAALDRRDNDKAAKEFTEALRFDPRLARAYRGRAEAYVRTMQWLRAIADANDALKIDDKDALAYELRARAYLDREDPDAALADLAIALRLNPNRARVYAARASALALKHERAEALAAADEAVRRAPMDFSVYATRGHVYTLLKENDKAIEDLSRALEIDPELSSTLRLRGFAFRIQGQLNKALADYNESLRLVPEHFSTYAARALVHQALKDPDAAQKDFEQTIALATEALQRDPRDVWAWSRRGLAHRSLKNWDATIEDLDKALEIDPGYAVALEARGETYRLKGDNEKAVADLLEVNRLRPRQSSAFTSLGLTYLAQKAYDKAIDAFLQALQIDPGSAFNLRQLGWARYNLKDYDQAIDHYSEVIQLAPTDAVALNDRGLAYAGKKEYRRAIEDYDASIKLNPAAVYVHNNRGNAHANLNENKEAVEDYTKAIAIDGKYTIAYGNRASAYIRLKEYAKAVEDLSRQLDLGPRTPGLLRRRAFCYEKANQPDKAKADRDEAAKLEKK